MGGELMELLLRRRGLMQKAASAPVPSPLVYSLENYAVSAGDSINTNVAPFVADYNSTILLDLTTTGNPTSGNGTAWRLLHCYNTPQGSVQMTLGKSSAWVNIQKIAWLETYMRELSGTVVTNPGRHRWAITHEANSNALNMHYKFGNNSILNFAHSSGVGSWSSTVETDYLCFGNPNDASQGLPPGTINKAQIYNTILTNAEIDDFFADN